MLPTLPDYSPMIYGLIS